MISKLSARLTYANVVSTICLFIVLGGTSYAVATGSIDSREIKNNTIRSKDVRNNSLLTRDFKRGELPAGPQGPAGPPGTAGPPGLSGVEVKTAQTTTDSYSPKTAVAYCPSGKALIGTGYQIIGGTSGGGGAALAHVIPTQVRAASNFAQVTVYERAPYPSSWGVIAEAVCASASP